MPRLFYGVELSLELKNYLASVLSPLKVLPKGWEHPHDYHMTLLFIGETPKAELSVLLERLKKIHFSPFTLTIRSVEFFNRRVLYLACDFNEDITRIRKELQDAFPNYLASTGKPFIPHITIKRWQRYEYEYLKKLIEANPFEKKSITIDHLALFKSEKDSENRKYHVIERIYSRPTKSSTSTILTAR